MRPQHVRIVIVPPRALLQSIAATRARKHESFSAARNKQNYYIIRTHSRDTVLYAPPPPPFTGDAHTMIYVCTLFQELPNLSEARAKDSSSQSAYGNNPIPPASYEFRLYSGKVLKLYAGDLYKLDGKLCKGAYTGDDFCDVSANTLSN